MQCRDLCGACCIAPSIVVPFFGMPQGKKAGERCVHLDAEQRCQIFESPERPPVCGNFQAEEAFCGDTQVQAMRILTELELITVSNN